MTPWTGACQASLSITNSQSLPKLLSIESVIPSNRLVCHPLLLQPSIFPGIRIFSNESASGGQSIGISASTSVLPMNIQDRFPLGGTGWISLQSKGFSSEVKVLFLKDKEDKTKSLNTASVRKWKSYFWKIKRTRQRNSRNCYYSVSGIRIIQITGSWHTDLEIM